MTVGQRIAQKRKELGLSQEGLGERLGVSRQAIYKWESDATLPEIEKLVALSRIFSVSVGWLLGVEEEERAAAEESAPDRELTEEQLRMVQEIVDRYLAARPKAGPAPQARPARRRWPVVLTAALALALAVALGNLFSRLDRVTQDYQNLQNAIGRIDSNVNSQIGSITSRVESILKSQNELTADYATELDSVNLEENSVTFAARAVPKTYTEGMTALFLADSGGGAPVEVESAVGPGQEFSACVTCPLTDGITLSVVFVTAGRRETQVLDVYDGFYSASFPELWLSGNMWGSSDGNVYRAEAQTIVLQGDMQTQAKLGDARAAGVKVGLFRDQKLVKWYRELPGQPDNWHGDFPEGTRWFQGEEDVTLEPGHVYCEAALVTDQYGRQWMTRGDAVEYNAEENFCDFVSQDRTSDPAGWIL